MIDPASVRGPSWPILFSGAEIASASYGINPNRLNAKSPLLGGLGHVIGGAGDSVVDQDGLRMRRLSVMVQPYKAPDGRIKAMPRSGVGLNSHP